MFKKIILFLMVISIAQLFKCNDNSSVNYSQNSEPPCLTLTMTGSPKDTLTWGMDTLFFGVSVRTTAECRVTQYPWSASEPVIIKVGKDSSYTSRALPISFSIIQGICNRLAPPSHCGFSVVLYSGFLPVPKQRYFYYAELVNYPSVRSSIRSFFLQ